MARKYDLHVKKDGKVRVYRKRPLPPRPSKSMVKAVCREPPDVLIAVEPGVWKEAPLLTNEERKKES